MARGLPPGSSVVDVAAFGAKPNNPSLDNAQLRYCSRVHIRGCIRFWKKEKHVIMHNHVKKKVTNSHGNGVVDVIKVPSQLE